MSNTVTHFLFFIFGAVFGFVFAFVAGAWYMNHNTRKVLNDADALRKSARDHAQKNVEHIQ